MQTIPLTNSDILAICDDDIFDLLLSIGPWRLTDKGYVAPRGEFGVLYPMHQTVCEANGIDLNGKTPDHRNRVRHDCRLANLRPATKRQQSLNQRKRSNNTSGYIGVHYHKQNRKWMAYAMVNRKNEHIGYFDDPIEAARARDAFVRTLPDAAFIPLNFPNE